MLVWNCPWFLQNIKICSEKILQHEVYWLIEDNII